MQNLYQNLMNLVANSDEKGFFYKDVKKDDQIYRVFNYHIPRTKAWSQPHALDCRGTMFNITNESSPELIALSMPKFFNWQENIFSQCDLSEIVTIYDKLDGSLMSSFMHKGNIWLKSKTELDKIHSVNSMKLLQQNQAMLVFTELATQDGFTVDFEYTGPDNHFIVTYPDNKLTILMLRNRSTGKLIQGAEICSLAKEKYQIAQWSDQFVVLPIAQGKQAHELINNIPKGNEGYVAVRNNGALIKIKSDWYTSQHLSLGDTSFKRIWECVISGSSDDLKALLIRQNRMTDEILSSIETAEARCNQLMTQWEEVKLHVDVTHHQDKKEFVMTLKEKYPQFVSIAIQYRDKKTIDFNQFLRKI